MSTREEIIKDFYNQYNEEERLNKSRQGQLEYFVTMDYIHRYLNKDSKILEIGAGTGRYSIALAKEGFDVTAIELSETNLNKLKENSKNIENIKSYQGDATELKLLEDDYFDVTLVFGPMYHLYDKDEINKAIDEAIRVTKTNGIILFSFLSIYAIMYTNYLYGNWGDGEKENFDEKYNIKHFKEQLFTGYDIQEFEDLFINKNIEKIDVVGTDGLLEAIEPRNDFKMNDDDFMQFKNYFLKFSNKRELLGSNSHLLYICKKR